MGMLSAQRRLHRETSLHVGPGRWGVQTGGRVAVRQGHHESALQRRDVFPKFFRGVSEISAGIGSLKFFRLGDGLCFRGRILARVIVEQSRHRRGIRAHFLDRLRKPLVDRAVHQPVGEPEHRNHGQERQQQADHHQARAELRTGHACPPFGIEFQQVASKNDGQRHEREEDQAAQSGKKQKLLIAVGADEFQIERGLRHQDREQQKSADRQRDHDARRPEVLVSSRIGFGAAKSRSHYRTARERESLAGCRWSFALRRISRKVRQASTNDRRLTTANHRLTTPRPQLIPQRPIRRLGSIVLIEQQRRSLRVLRVRSDPGVLVREPPGLDRRASAMSEAGRCDLAIHVGLPLQVFRAGVTARRRRAGRRPSR